MSIADRFWYGLRPAHLLLFPLSLLFRAAVAVRRALYRSRVLRSEALPVPVIVVGNISVGGTGKTPLVIWLAHELSRAGWQPGIVTRGYGGSERTQAIDAHADVARSGDEALLLARNSGCPVWSGADRVAAAKGLLAAHPACDVLISDDGLQHYRMRRNIEVAVVDARRGLGNGLLLPAGPLREPASRLACVDAVVINGEGATRTYGRRRFAMRLSGERVVNLRDPRRQCPAAQLTGPIHAIAGIGDPRRFFEHLQHLGLHIRPHPFPDHHRFSADDLAFAGEEAVVMTEKDAVKCEDFSRENFWFLPVEAQIDAALADHILALLRTAHGRQAA